MSEERTTDQQPRTVGGFGVGVPPASFTAVPPASFLGVPPASFQLPSPREDFPPMLPPAAPPTAMPTPGQPLAPMPTPAPAADDGQPYSAGGDPVRGIFWRNADGSGPGPISGGTPIPLVPPTQPGAPTPLHPSTPDGLPWQSSSFFGNLVGIESGGRNIVSRSDGDSRGLKLAQGGNGAEISQGYFQINTPTWRDFAPQAGVDLRQYPRAMLAPADVQLKVAQLIPFGRFGPITQQKMEAIYGPLSKTATIGELAAEHGDRGTYAAPKTYTPATGHTPPSQWGRFSPSMLQRDLPAPSQTNDILHGAGAALLMLGSAFTGGALTPMINFYAHYVNARTEANRHKWQDALKESTARATMEAMDYGSAFSQFTDDKGNVTDPQGLSDEISNVAYQYGDTTMLHALQQGGVGAAQRLANGRNNWNMDLMKLHSGQAKMELEEQKFILDTQFKMATLERANARDARERQAADAKLAGLRQQRAALAAAGVPESQLPTVPGGEEPAAEPAAEPTAEPTTEPGAEPGAEPPADGAVVAPTAAPAPTTTAPGRAGGPVTPITPGMGRPAAVPAVAPAAAPAAVPTAAPGAAPLPAQPQPQAPTRPATPAPQIGAPRAADGSPSPQPRPTGNPQTDVEVAASQLVNGAEASQIKDLLPKGAITYAGHLALQKWSQIRALENSNLTGQGMIDALHAIDPTYADTLTAVAANRRPQIASTGFASRLAGYSQISSSLAEKINPQWRIGQYEALQRTRDSYSPQGRMGQTLARSQRLVPLARSVWNLAGNLPNDAVPLNTLQTWLNTGIAGEPAYTNFVAAWRQFAIESTNVSMMGSQSVTLSEALMRVLSMGHTPEQIRGAMQTDLIGAVGALDTAQRTYAHGFPGEGPPPTWDQESHDALQQIIDTPANIGADLVAPGGPDWARGQLINRDGHVIYTDGKGWFNADHSPVK